MESALYGIYPLVVFVSEILLVRCAHSFNFWYVNNSCINTVRHHFPWSILYFPTDHLTSRNWKQSLRKYTYWHSNVFRSLQIQCRVFCTFTRIFLASKQVRKSWYSKAKKNTLILYTHAAIQVQAFWRKLKKLRLFRHNKSLMLYQR